MNPDDLVNPSTRAGFCFSCGVFVMHRREVIAFNEYRLACDPCSANYSTPAVSWEDRYGEIIRQAVEKQPERPI